MQTTLSADDPALRRFLTAQQVLQRYQISHMCLWRGLRDSQLNFPKPMRVNARRYWLEEDLAQWERARAPRSSPATV